MFNPNILSGVKNFYFKCFSPKKHRRGESTHAVSDLTDRYLLVIFNPKSSASCLLVVVTSKKSVKHKQQMSPKENEPQHLSPQACSPQANSCCRWRSFWNVLEQQYLLDNSRFVGAPDNQLFLF